MQMNIDYHQKDSYFASIAWCKLIKNGTFWRVFENLKLAVKQCYQTGQF